jgi:anti-sigma regulatory factor (Ser/Thr protein kinase)
MEWRFDAVDPTSTALLRDEVVAYLRRHGDPASDFDAAAVIVSELLSNVWRHTDRVAWVQAVWPADRAIVVVRDVGPGFDWQPAPVPVDAIGGRGLYIADRLAESVTVDRRAGGSVVTVVLPVSRIPAVSLDPPRHRLDRLPALAEATPGTGFGRESFLRALAVQLAENVEERFGPDDAEALVAQVGIDVGTQMEAEYRAAVGHHGPFDAAHLGACFVRLKAAIGGSFTVVDIADEHVTLENTACPFGPVVQHAPGLCRMTSSVFGGIAARATGTEAVVGLEERIAVGDARCRVTVRFGSAAGETTWGHRYRPETTDVTPTD